ncbi:tetratricopeptide repeat protein [Deinococcus cellulosilyticus]|uniref:Uncharacterized protein n=1 Tax=Deinococcus cellulosilyticus (strain DSM 18568 / NBRC 106333 / KACC 11606 / 5516J-15) TaxID=1223518 RepID=A0A511N569_DEIC1|nr:tetratricopeptide repeat protein [Deinococcus cellulosilyticus]GEM47617.1 hypothetical protein DC3_32520 [Deinococcus cellulosilyticus NBRC 106333 = KACC 11606]
MSLIEQAWNAFDAGDFEQARTLYEQHLDAHPTDEQARFGLGYVYVNLGLFEEAEGLYQGLYQEALQSQDPRAHQAMHQIGMLRRVQGDYAGALTAFEQEKPLIPDDPFPRAINTYELGMCHLRLGNTEKASVELHTSLFYAQRSMDPIAQACAYRGIGELHLAQDNYTEAQPAFLEAIRCFEAAGEKRGVEDIIEYIKELEEASRNSN